MIPILDARSIFTTDDLFVKTDEKLLMFNTTLQSSYHGIYFCVKLHTFSGKSTSKTSYISCLISGKIIFIFSEEKDLGSGNFCATYAYVYLDRYELSYIIFVC